MFLSNIDKFEFNSVKIINSRVGTGKAKLEFKSYRESTNLYTQKLKSQEPLCQCRLDVGRQAKRTYGNFILRIFRYIVENSLDVKEHMNYEKPFRLVQIIEHASIPC